MLLKEYHWVIFFQKISPLPKKYSSGFLTFIQGFFFLSWDHCEY